MPTVKPVQANAERIESVGCFDSIKNLVSRIMEAVMDCVRCILPCFFSKVEAQAAVPAQSSLNRAEIVASPRSRHSGKAEAVHPQAEFEEEEKEFDRVDMTASMVRMGTEQPDDLYEDLESISASSSRKGSKGLEIADPAAALYVVLETIETLWDKIAAKQKPEKSDLTQALTTGVEMWNSQKAQGHLKFEQALELFPSLKKCVLIAQAGKFSEMSEPTLVLEDEEVIGTRYIKGIEERLAALRATAVDANTDLIAGVFSKIEKDITKHYGIFAQFAGRSEGVAKYTYHLINPYGKEGVSVEKFGGADTCKNRLVKLTPVERGDRYSIQAVIKE